MYKAIIFDFFGVICSEVAPFWFQKYFSKTKAVRLEEQYFYKIDRGLISVTELFSQLGDLVGIPHKQVEEEFFSLVHIDNDVVDFIKKIKPETMLVLCSNASADFLRGILKRYKLEDLFDIVVISSEIGTIKPDQKIYQEVLKQLKLTSSEVFFIDDNPVNVDGAKKIGIEGTVFKSVAQLENIFS